LLLSVLWGLFVWYIGEGLGGLASGHTLLLMGAPGAALIYALLALAVLPDSGEADQHPAGWLVIIWAVLWTIGAVYQLLPGQNSTAALSSMIGSNASGAPAWLASLDLHLASLIQTLGAVHKLPVMSPGMHMTSLQMAQMPMAHSSGAWLVVAAAIVQLLVGLAVFVPGPFRLVGIGAGICLALVFWVVGESLGSYYTGLATDPNSGPLFVLLALSILGCTQYDHRLRRLYRRFETVLVGADPQNVPPA
jgi:hypothetical protein